MLRHVTLPRCESDRLSRRTFLQTGVTAMTGLALASGHGRTFAAEAGEDGPRRITAGAPQNFVDLQDVESLKNVRHIFHTAEKHPENPVLVGEAEWERVQGAPAASFIYDEEEKLFKVWYQGVIGDRRGRVHTYGPHTLNYAISRDGIRWERPKLRLHEFTYGGESTRDNNIVIPQTYHEGKDHWESVLKDSSDPDPQRRYKALGWSSYDWDGPMSGIYTMTSPDGLRWSHTPEPVFHYHPRPGTDDLGPVGDAQSLMIDMQNKRYVAFLRGPRANRLFSVSEDFVRWSPPAESMPAIPSKTHAPFYNHMGFCYGDQHLGLVSHYVVEEDLVHHLRVRLLSSRDGLHFELPGPQPFDRPALIDVGEIGEWDRFMCLITGAPPIRVGDRLYIYYRGSSETHDRSAEKPKDSYYAGANGLATLRVDGFASLGAGFDRGTVTTKPILFQGRLLSVNAKANFYGGVLVEILDQDGRPVPGYTAEDAVPIAEDRIDALVAWKGRHDLRELSGRPVKLRFHLTNARLYAYRIG